MASSGTLAGHGPSLRCMRVGSPRAERQDPMAKGTPPRERPTRSSWPEIEAKSIWAELCASGAPRAGTRLEDLKDEVPLPEFQMGPEKYSIVRELGAGGMGKVYLAYDHDLKRHVALKLVRGEGHRFAQRFVEEARVMAQLDHPNIVPVFEVGLTGGRPYYTMRVVRGQTLGGVLAQLAAGDAGAQRRYSLVRRMQIYVEICQAVSYAHAKGVLHRDLKPANVMLGRHGVVQVMDWGLSKVFRAGGVETTLATALTETGAVVGTPSYMAPEQMQGREVDERADIYALGVILYQLLTQTRPFEGEQAEVMERVLGVGAVPPRQRAPDRDVPLELEGVCLRALEGSRERRPASADELIGEVQTWLEAESDKEKRRELATAKAEEGRQRLEQYHRMQQEVSRLEASADALAKRFESWQPAEQKAEMFAAEDAVSIARRQLVESSADSVETLERALEYDGDNATARELLADYYWSRFEQAEEQADEDERDFFTQRVRRYHDGKYARELTGDGSLALSSIPAGAEVWLHEYVSEGPVLVAGNARSLGTTPISPLPLALGSYLAVVKKDGYRDVLYPVCISRNKEWTGEVKMYPDEEIGQGFVYVPAGPFIQGGDEEAHGWSLPRSEPFVAGFFIAEHPVTVGEYLEFLNDVARTEGVDAAHGRAPRHAPKTGSYLRTTAAGLLAMPEIDEEGDRWYPRLPVMAISWYDAVAYCDWRSAQDQREYRPPTETEWEKAARGVDGRWFPWGDRFDPSLCNMVESQRERTTIAVVDEFPTDVSVYGVRGMAGNMRDWTSTEHVGGSGEGARIGRVVRGGAWSSTRIDARCTGRDWDVLYLVVGSIGLRLARSAPT